jgi:oligopeptidase A
VALDEIDEDLGITVGIANHLLNVNSSPDLRAGIDQVTPKVLAFNSGLNTDSQIYGRVKEFAATPEARSLTGARKRLLEMRLDDFRRGGAELDEASKSRLRAISLELDQLSKKYSQNVLDSTNAFDIVITDESKLAGLSEGARAAARQSAKAKGIEGWRFTLQMPSQLAVMTYLEDRGIRERMQHASMTIAARAPYDNRPIMSRILELRRERTKMLGYRTFADLTTQHRMAGSGDNVKAFLSGLDRKTRPFYETEQKELLAFRRSLEGPDAPLMETWDLQFYAEKMRKARFDFDAENLRPYFTLDNVLNGVFQLAGRLYGVRISEVQGVPVWHPSVRFFEVRDAGGSVLGSFYADMFPRESKRAGGWTAKLLPGAPESGGYRAPVLTIAANVSQPLPGKPALLSLTEVTTTFHEFGHAMQGILERLPVKGFGYPAWDFVEVPSMIMQNFIQDRGVLDLFARHYQAGERLPDNLYDAMTRARTFRAATAQMGQLSLGTVDILMHTEYQGDADLIEYARNVQQRFSAAPLGADSAKIASFSHVFAGGYAAGYYSYKWAEVIEADAFTRFQKEGVLNPKVGMDFRTKVLEKGDSADAGSLVRDFLGRDPDPDAVLRRNGLIAKQ